MDGMQVSYSDNKTFAYFNGLKFRKDTKTGYYLCTSNINAKRPRLHRYVWEYYNGSILENFHVHHIDQDKNNNEIDNLQLLLEEEHSSLHGQNIPENVKDKMRKNLLENAVPKSKQWHSSKEGKDWHKKHYENVKAKMHSRVIRRCDNCGKEFNACNNNMSRFCSNNCKSSWRRKMGYDNETKSCVICGKEFIKNKYSKSKTCSPKCRGELRKTSICKN